MAANNIRLKSCFMHFSDISESVFQITKIRLAKFISCRQRWVNLQCEQSEICRKSYEYFSDETVEEYLKGDVFELEWPYHKTCYKRLCDEEKIKRAQKKSSCSVESGTSNAKKSGECNIECEKRRSSRLSEESCKRLRSVNVLPERCIICKRDSSWFKMNKKSGKRTRVRLMLCETENAGLLRLAAERKNDENILVHIRGRDCVAIEVRYHKCCYLSYTHFLKTRFEDLPCKSPYQNGYKKFCKEVIEIELIGKKQIRYMSDLHNQFVNFMENEEGVDASTFRRFRLKERLSQSYPQLVFHKPKMRTSEIVYVEHLESEDIIEEHMTLKSIDDAKDIDYNDTDAADAADAVDEADSDSRSLRELYYAAMMLRDKIKKQAGLDPHWPLLASDLTMEKAKSVVPIPLFNFLAWISGSSEDAQVDEFVTVESTTSNKLMSIAQDIVHVTSEGRKLTPKCVALAMSLRQMTGSSSALKLVNILGHCMSHKFVLRHETALAQLTMSENNSLPPGFCMGTPVTLAWDNDDFCEETRSGKGTTHVTGGIIVQRCWETSENQIAEERRRLPKHSQTLPATAEGLEPYILGRKVTVDLREAISSLPRNDQSSKLIEQEKRKLDLAFVLCRTVKGFETQIPSWTGFNTELQHEHIPSLTNIGYLPIIDASPTQLSTIVAILDRSKEVADLLELDYITLVFDEAIYSKIQQIRWKENIYFNKCIVRLGDFHMAMSYCGAISKLFKDAGLQNLIVESDLVAVGSLAGVLSGKHYNRCVRSHKVIYEALTRLLFQSFVKTLSLDDQEEILAFIECMAESYPNEQVYDCFESPELHSKLASIDNFAKSRSATNPTFALWLMYLEMVEILLLFIRATRENNWELHLSAVRLMLPWFFVADRVNYARYGTMYWLEMSCLESTHPGALEAVKENWTCQRQKHYGFSSTACDQVMEQTFNRDSKTKGGITGFSLNRSAVKRWILSQSERGSITRQCHELAGIIDTDRETIVERKELDSTQIANHNSDVDAVVERISTMMNPFDTDLEELVNITNGEVAHSDVKQELLKANVIGEGKLDNFIRQKVTSTSPDIFSSIPSTKLKTFLSQKNMKTQTHTSNGTAVELRNDSKFIARLLAIGESREIDVKNLMMYSLRKFPQALATFDGLLVKTAKVKLLHVIENRCHDCSIDSLPLVTCNALMIDGLAVIQTMKDLPKTFGSLAESIIKRVINTAKSFNASRVDFICDQYPEISIKNLERSKRAEAGSTFIKICNADQKLPRQFKKFLLLGKNKEALIEFLFRYFCKRTNMSNILKTVELFLTHGQHCHCFHVDANGLLEINEVLELNSDHEEADTRIMLHAEHASHEYRNVILKSPDTDVFILAVGHKSSVNASLFFVTGTGNKYRIIDIGNVQEQLGESLSTALIGFHSFTGCDSTSSFFGKGKTKPFKILEQSQEFIETFNAMGCEFSYDHDLLAKCEKFVCWMYSQSESTEVNTARLNIFRLGQFNEESMPCTKDVLSKHLSRCNYQATIWRRALHPFIMAPDITGHGWKVADNMVSIHWMDLPPAPDSILENVNCGCQPGCSTRRCSCLKENLSCTDLCRCQGCTNRSNDLDNEDEILDKEDDGRDHELDDDYSDDEY